MSALNRLLRQQQVQPEEIEELGAKEEDIPELAEKVKYADNGLVGNFYPLDRAAVEEVYRIACQSRDN